MASSPVVPLADKAVPLGDFEHGFALGHLSSQNEYFPSIFTSDVGVEWSGRSDKALSHPEPPMLNCKFAPFATQGDSEHCLRTAECALHVDQEYLSWRQFCQSPDPQAILTPGHTCSSDICSGWSPSPQGPTLNDCNSFRGPAVIPKQKEALLGSRAPLRKCILPYQHDYPKSEGWDTYGPCGTSSELLDTALPFATSANEASPETTPSIAFPSQYWSGDSDPPGNPLSLQHTSSETACIIGHALRAPYVLSYDLTEPESSVHEAVRPIPKSTESFSALAPESDSFVWSSSPCLSDSLEYTSGISSKKTARRNSKDGFLIRSKLSGMSYREIKVKGRFKEAESTLRGRFRTLTKRKEQRVRKPQWQERDVSNLHLAHALPRELDDLTCHLRYSCFAKQCWRLPRSRRTLIQGQAVKLLRSS